MNSGYQIPTLPLVHDLETRATLRQATKTSRALAELKGLASTIPNEQILISTLTLQEAKESSEVENIVTTQDDLYHADLQFPHHWREKSETFSTSAEKSRGALRGSSVPTV